MVNMITALCGYFSGTFVSDTGGTFKSDTPGTFVSDIGGTFEVILSTVSKNKNRKSINITWPTLRKSQLKTLEDTAINSLSKLSYLRFNN